MSDQTNQVPYAALFRQLPDNYLLISPDLTIVDNTDSHEAVSMKKRAEVVGRNFYEAYPETPDNQAAVIRESHRHVLEHHEPHAMPIIRYDLERPQEQGGGFEERYWQATHYPILNEQGELLYILQKTEDITRQHEADRQRQAVQHELEKTQQRSSFILEALPVMVWTSRPDGNPDYFNQRWSAFTGMALEELLNQGWTKAVHPDDLPEVLARWEQAIAQHADFQVEYRLKRTDSVFRWVLTRAVPRISSQGEVDMWVGSATDIHDQKQLVQELLEANEQQALLSDQLQQAFQLAETQREMFFNLFMQAPAQICILRGPEHVFEFVNPGYQQLFPHRQLLGKAVAEALPEVIEQGFIQILDGVYQTGKPFYGNELHLLLDRDGSGTLSDSYFNFIYQAIQEDGTNTGIAVFAFEVTDLVLARKTLEQLNASGNASR